MNETTARTSAGLEQELSTYQKSRDELLAHSEGKWVLIGGDRVIGVYETQMDAVSQGYRELGPVPFLVKEIVQVEMPEVFVSNLLAI